MSGRQSSAVAAAVRMVGRGHSISASARAHSVAVSSVRRALRAAGAPPAAGGRP